MFILINLSQISLSFLPDFRANSPSFLSWSILTILTNVLKPSIFCFFKGSFGIPFPLIAEKYLSSAIYLYCFLFYYFKMVKENLEQRCKKAVLKIGDEVTKIRKKLYHLEDIDRKLSHLIENLKADYYYGLRLGKDYYHDYTQ